MSGSAAALPKNKNSNKKGHQGVDPDYMPDLRRQSSPEESVGQGEEGGEKKKKKKEQQQKKGSADIGSSQSGSTGKKPKKKTPVGIRKCTPRWSR